jgi:hypothetical protein
MTDDTSTPTAEDFDALQKALAYDLGAYDAHHLLIAAALGDVFKARIVPRVDPSDPGDEVHMEFGKYIGLPEDKSLVVIEGNLNRLRGRPDFVKILREKIYADVGRQLLFAYHLGDLEFVPKDRHA